MEHPEHWWTRPEITNVIRNVTQDELDQGEIAKDEESRIFAALVKGITKAVGAPPVFAEGCLWVWDHDFGVWSRCTPPQAPREHCPSFAHLWRYLSGLFIWNHPLTGKPYKSKLRVSARLETALDRQPLRHTDIHDLSFFESSAKGVVMPTIDQGDLLMLLWQPLDNGTITLVEPEPYHRLRYLLFDRGVSLRSQAVDARHVKTPPPVAEWIGYLRSMWGEDEEVEAKIEVMEMFVGASLAGTATRHQRMLIWQGRAGANGKSLLAEVVASLIIADRRLVAACSPADWEGFGASALDGKLLNIVTELPEEKTFHSDRVKAVVAGDPIYVDVKYAQGYVMMPSAAHLLSVNSLPPMSDLSGGLRRRLIVQEFNRSFLDDAERKTKDEIFGDLLPFAPLIRVRCLHAAARLQQRGDYPETLEHKNAIGELVGRSSSAGSFIEDCLQVPPGDEECDWWVYQAELYTAYRRYCIATGERYPKKARQFYRALETHGLRRESFNQGRSRRKFERVSLRPVTDWGVDLADDDMPPHWAQ